MNPNNQNNNSYRNQQQQYQNQQQQQYQNQQQQQYQNQQQQQYQNQQQQQYQNQQQQQYQNQQQQQYQNQQQQQYQNQQQQQYQNQQQQQYQNQQQQQYQNQQQQQYQNQQQQQYQNQQQQQYQNQQQQQYWNQQQQQQYLNQQQYQNQKQYLNQQQKYPNNSNNINHPKVVAVIENNWWSQNKHWCKWALIVPLLLILLGITLTLIFFLPSKSDIPGFQVVDVNDYMVEQELIEKLQQINVYNQSLDRDDFEKAFANEVVIYLNSKLDNVHKMKVENLNIDWSNVDWLKSGDYEVEITCYSDYVVGTASYDIHVLKYQELDLDTANFSIVSNTFTDGKIDSKEKLEPLVNKAVKTAVLNQLQVGPNATGDNFTNDDINLNIVINYEHNNSGLGYQWDANRVTVSSDDILFQNQKDFPISMKVGTY